MSAKTEFIPSKESKVYGARKLHKTVRKLAREEALSKAKNHVSADNNFKFEGPKARPLTDAQKNAKNISKRNRKAA